MNPIVCALDTRDLDKAVFLARVLRNKISMVKLGLEFFAAHGPYGVKEMAKCNIPIFLDLKLYDIPSIVAKTIDTLKGLGIEMLTLHINGGTKMLKEALNAVKNTQIKLIGITVLTSINNEDLNELKITKEVKQEVVFLSKLAKDIGIHGVVCSAAEAMEVRRECGDNFTIITPGIRMNSNNDDQKRIATPKEAISSGANYIVIGRPIIKSDSPENSAKSIYRSLIIN